MVKQLEKWAELNNYPTMGDVVLAQGLPCLLGYSFWPSNRLYSINVPLEQDQWSKELQKALKAALIKIKGFASISYNKKDRNIIVFIKAPMLGGVNKLFEALGNVTEVLVAAMEEQHLRYESVCRICKQSGSDDCMAEDQSCFPAHKACKEEKSRELLSKISENQTYGNYFIGVICAVIGGVVGFIPSFITIAFMQRVYVMLFLLIPMAVYCGYKIGKGYLNRATPFIVSAIALIDTFVLLIVLNWAWIVPMGFCLLGIVFTWGYISHGNKDLHKQAKELAGQAGGLDEQ